MSLATATFPRFLQDETFCPRDCLETYLIKATEKFRSTKKATSFSYPSNDHTAPVAKTTMT